MRCKLCGSELAYVGAVTDAECSNPNCENYPHRTPVLETGRVKRERKEKDDEAENR